MKAEAEGDENNMKLHSKTREEVLETKLAGYLQETIQETVSQCRERLIRFLVENRKIKEERETGETLVQKGKELEEEKRKIIVQAKKKLRKKDEEIRELRKKMSILEGRINKMEELSKVNIKLLSENENLHKELSLLRTKKELESSPATVLATAPNPDPANNFTRKRKRVAEDEDNTIPEKEIKLEKEEVTLSEEEEKEKGIEIKKESDDLAGFGEGREVNEQELSPGRTKQLLIGDQGNLQLTLAQMNELAALIARKMLEKSPQEK